MVAASSSVERLVAAVLSAAGCIGVVVFAVAAAAIGIWLSRRGAKAERERTERLRAFAESRGAQFFPLFPQYVQELPRFSLFVSGHSQRAFNVACGAATIGGMPCRCVWGEFLYMVTYSTGKTTMTVPYTHGFLAVQPPLALAEELVVRREGFLDRVGEMLGSDDIDFESDAFSRAFHVKASNRRFAFDLFDPRMIEFFMSSDPPAVELCGNWMLFDRGPRRMEPPLHAADLEWADQFLLRVPRHLRAERLPRELHANDPVLSPSASANGGER